MQRNRRVAAAATAGTLAVAGVAAALVVNAVSARADTRFCTVPTSANPAGMSCTLSGTINAPQRMDIQVTSNTTVSAGEPYTLTWQAICSDASGSQATTSGQSRANATATSTPAQINVTTSVTNPASCVVTATLTAGTLAVSTDTITAVLQYTPQPAPSSTSASPSPSPTSSAAGSSGGSGTKQVKGFGGKCLDDAKNSASLRAKIVIWNCSSSDKAEQWGYAGGEIKHNGLCLNAKGSGGRGSTVILWTCNGAPNEIWVYNSLNNEILLRAHGFQFCLNDPRYSTRNGTQLIVYPCQDTPNEHWSMP